jgi:hypothetical protein
MGHADPALALRVYRQTMRPGDDEIARLRALVNGFVATRPLAAESEGHPAAC